MVRSASIRSYSREVKQIGCEENVGGKRLVWRLIDLNAHLLFEKDLPVCSSSGSQVWLLSNLTIKSINPSKIRWTVIFCQSIDVGLTSPSFLFWSVINQINLSSSHHEVIRCCRDSALPMWGNNPRLCSCYQWARSQGFCPCHGRGRGGRSHLEQVESVRTQVTIGWSAPLHTWTYFMGRYFPNMDWCIELIIWVSHSNLIFLFLIDIHSRVTVYK